MLFAPVDQVVVEEFVPWCATKPGASKGCPMASIVGWSIGGPWTVHVNYVGFQRSHHEQPNSNAMWSPDRRTDWITEHYGMSQVYHDLRSTGKWSCVGGWASWNSHGAVNIFNWVPSTNTSYLWCLMCAFLFSEFDGKKKGWQIRPQPGSSWI